MPIDPKLLDILVCPITKLPVVPLDSTSLSRLNHFIKSGGVTFQNGELIEEPLEEALITNNKKTIYRIDQNIPVMLEDQAIFTDQISGW